MRDKVVELIRRFSAALVAHAGLGFPHPCGESAALARDGRRASRADPRRSRRWKNLRGADACAQDQGAREKGLLHSYRGDRRRVRKCLRGRNRRGVLSLGLAPTRTLGFSWTRSTRRSSRPRARWKTPSVSSGSGSTPRVSARTSSSLAAKMPGRLCQTGRWSSNICLRRAGGKRKRRRYQPDERPDAESVPPHRALEGRDRDSSPVTTASARWPPSSTPSGAAI